MNRFQWSLETPSAGLSLLRLAGEMSLSDREGIRAAFDALCAAAGPLFAMDFTDVRLVSSAAIGELARCQHRLTEAGGATRLICPTGDILEILEIADMHRLIPLYPDLATLEAERALR